ncbi:hypothetical protein D1872_300950 [compost metagenome]
MVEIDFIEFRLRYGQILLQPLCYTLEDDAPCIDAEELIERIEVVDREIDQCTFGKECILVVLFDIVKEFQSCR